MQRWAQAILRLDRRIIFLLVAAAVLYPLLRPVGLPIRETTEVRRIYDYMESLPPGSVLLLSMDFDPTVKPELDPMARALLRHAFRRNLRVIGMTLMITGTGLAEGILSEMAAESGKKYGVDYVFLGWSPGLYAVILNMGESISRAFPTDHYGNRTSGIPVLQKVQNLRDVQYVVSLTGSSIIETWIVFGRQKYGFELGGGSTGVVAPGLFPFLNTGQLNGLLGGLRGAAEYEILLGQRGKAVAGMDAQSVTHLMIIALILLCNLIYAVMGWDRRRR